MDLKVYLNKGITKTQHLLNGLQSTRALQKHNIYYLLNELQSTRALQNTTSFKRASVIRGIAKHNIY